MKNRDKGVICMNNIDYVSILTLSIDWFLRIVQIITFIVLILKINHYDNYIDNVRIKKINPDNLEELNSEFHYIYEYEHIINKAHTDLFLIYPKNVDIKKIEVFSLKFDEKLIEDELLYTKNNLINNYSLLIKTIVPETIPNLKVKWETSKGELGEYTFNNNGYNGNVDISSYKYKLTFKRKILSIFKL